VAAPTIDFIAGCLLEVWGKGVYFLCPEMSALDYMMEEAHSCTADDANAMAFKEVAKIIEDRDAVEEFLACGVLPLSNGWDFEFEEMESPLSKVTVLMPKVTAIIAERETWRPLSRELLQRPTCWLGIIACQSIVLARLSFNTAASTACWS
jgi:hypothetical protein